MARLLEPLLFLALSGVLLLAAEVALQGRQEPQECEMTFMWPEYFLLHEMDGTKSRLGGRYQLYLYKDGGWDPGTEVGYFFAALRE